MTLNTFSLDLPLWQPILAISLTLSIVIALAVRRLSSKTSPAAALFRVFGLWVLPAATALALCLLEFHLPTTHTAVRILETLLWIGNIWVVVSLIKIIFFSKPDDQHWRARVPGLLVDLVRFAVILIGTFMVIALVWEGNLSGALATLGVGSLVIGLALQETLGNLFAGISLVLERSIQIGEWITVGDLEGQVVGVNWRSVYIQTRSLDLVVIPNSVLARERIHNYSRPTAVHAFEVVLSFSYNDPPNKVKRVITECARRTRDVLHMGMAIRVDGFGDSAVNYRPRLFTERYDRLHDIKEEFLTHVWYAARRHGLTIPYPIRTVFKTEVPAAAIAQSEDLIAKELGRMPLFQTLDSREFEEIVADSIIEEFGAGETIVAQGENGDCLHVISQGKVDIFIATTGQQQEKISTLSAGEYFGEMALLTGEPRSATAIACDDVTLITVYREALSPILLSRPELAASLAECVERRKSGLQEVRDTHLSKSTSVAVNGSEGAILGRIRRFFGLDAALS